MAVRDALDDSMQLVIRSYSLDGSFLRLDEFVASAPSPVSPSYLSDLCWSHLQPLRRITSLEKYLFCL